MAIGNIARANGFTKEEAVRIAAGASSGGGLDILNTQYQRSAEFKQKVKERQETLRLDYQAQQMGIQQQFVDQQLKDRDRTM